MFSPTTILQTEDTEKAPDSDPLELSDAWFIFLGGGVGCLHTDRPTMRAAKVARPDHWIFLGIRRSFFWVNPSNSGLFPLNRQKHLGIIQKFMEINSGIWKNDVILCL